MNLAVRFDARLYRRMTMAAAALAVGSFFMSNPAAAQSTWTTCAGENQVCSFSGTRTVRYGTGSTWVTRQVTASGGGVQCSNGVFGDPADGFVKTCQLESVVASTSWTLCANENARCSFTGTRRVRYGAGTRWATRDVTASSGGVVCSNESFGDPAPGTVKHCELSGTGGGTTQQPPTISGSPATSAAVGSTYRFQPTARDPNGDAIAFTITNRPSWITFNTTNGLLTGQPTLANVGAHSNIIVRVSDGTSTVSLPAFAINVAQQSSGTAALSWMPPTTNSNGSSLTNLAGYRIYYGTSSTAMTQTIQVAQAGIANYVVSGLTRGTYYFTVRAYNTAGAESTASNIASKTLL